MSWTLAVMVSALVQAGAPGSGTHKGLLEVVPHGALTVVVVDHGRLATHPAYVDVMRLLYHRRLARGISALGEAGGPRGAELGTTVSFVLPGGKTGEILRVPPDTFERIKTHLSATHKRPPTEGKTGERPWVRWDKGLTLGLLEGDRAVFGPHEAVLRVQGLTPGGSGTLKKRRHYGRMVSGASRGAPPAWGLSWDGDPARAVAAQRPTHGYLRVVGKGDLDVECVAYTKDEEAAKAVIERARRQVEDKLVRPPVMRALGISWLAQQLKLTSKGARIDARVHLLKGQAVLLARMGPEVLVALGVP